MYNSRAMGIKSAALFRMGGCCQICTTNFYRDLALLEVEESQKVATLKSFHGWKLAGVPVSIQGKPDLSNKDRRMRHSVDGENSFNEHLAAFMEVREEVLAQKHRAGAENNLKKLFTEEHSQSLSGQRNGVRKVLFKSSQMSKVRKGGNSKGEKSIKMENLFKVVTGTDHRRTQYSLCVS